MKTLIGFMNTRNMKTKLFEFFECSKVFKKCKILPWKITTWKILPRSIALEITPNKFTLKRLPSGNCPREDYSPEDHPFSNLLPESCHQENCLRRKFPHKKLPPR